MRCFSCRASIPVLLFLLIVAAVPKLRPAEEQVRKPPKVQRATSRPAPPSEQGEVPIVAGVETESFTKGHGSRPTAERRSFFASIGIIARYDVWLNPAPSRAEFVPTGRSNGVIEARSRSVEADGVTPTGTANEGTTPDPLLDSIRSVPAAEETLARGVEAFRVGDFPRAFEDLKRGALLAKDSGLARHTFALSQFALGDYEGAAASLRRAVELWPDLPKMGLEIRSLYDPDGRDLEDQRLALDSHVRVHPADRAAALVAAWIAVACGETAAARAGFASLTQSDPNDSVAAAYLAAIDP